jgi:DNA-binding XRE family transcriptional regulator
VKNNLEEYRLKCGFRKQNEFAAFLEMDPTHYSRIVKQTMQPNYETMVKIKNKIKEFFPDIIVEDIFTVVAD